VKILTLARHLLKFWFKYGNQEIDIVTESHFTSAEILDIIDYQAIQVEQHLGDIAFSPSEKRVKLLPKGF